MLKIASTRENSAVRRFIFTDKPSKPGNVSFFLLTHGLSVGVTHTMNMEIEKFDIFIFTLGGGGGVSVSMDGWGCAILALELVPKNLIFT